MLNQESAQENEKQRLLWNFEIKTGHLILARRTHLVIVKKKKKKKRKENLPTNVLGRTGRPQTKIKRLA